MKYPIGIQNFPEIIQDGYVYVDKTDLVYRLVSTGKIYFLSRPRRFGKSLLLSTLESYFLGRKELFKGLAIDRLEQEWLEYPVFYLDFNSSTFTEPGGLTDRILNYLGTWESQYGRNPYANGLGSRFSYVLEQAHRKTGRRAVVLVDEYDKPILDVMDTGYTTTVDGQVRSLEETNREILKGFYSVIKATDKHLKFVMLTGVTKFSQESVFSGFNQPNDISMVAKYETICGITQQELDSCFAGSIQELADSLGVSPDEMKKQLKQQYDGYHFSHRLTDIYNPYSLLSCFKKMSMGDYWFKTGTPTYLVRLLDHNREYMNELTGRYFDPAEFIDYRANVEKPLPMIYQSGYLTIKEYDRELGLYQLDYPNNEVRKGFLTMVATDYLKPESESVEAWAPLAARSLKRGEVDTFRKLLTSFLAGIPYSMRRKKTERERERYFHYTFYLLMRLISNYTVYTEKQQSQGRVDCIIETDRYVYIFEFKLDGTAEEALRQIEQKGYARPYESDARQIYRIGVSFSSATGTIEDFLSLPPHEQPTTFCHPER